MGSENFLNQVGYWLISSKEYHKLTQDKLGLGEQVLPGEYFYQINSGNLYLIRLVDADGITMETLRQNQVQSFAALERLRENNNLNFAYEVVVYVFAQGILPEVAKTIQDSKQVSALSRCYLLPWVVDLQKGETLQHKGMPMGNFGLLSQDSPLCNPTESQQVLVNLQQLERDNRQVAPVRRKVLPVITYALMGICLVIAGLTRFSADPVVMTIYGAKVNDLVAQGQYWRLFTSMFLHFGLMHLAFNMLFLYSIGPGVEGLFGRVRYLIIFVLAGLLGSAASFALTTAISAGASGALFGLLGAYLYFWLKHPRAGKQIGRTVISLVAYNLLFGLILGVVDNWAHLGGLAGGFLAAAIVGLPGEKRVSLGKLAAVAGFSLLILVAVFFGRSQEATPTRIDFAVQRQIEEARYLALNSNDYSGAERILLDALKKQPNSANAHYLLGVTYLAQGQLQQAQSELLMTVKLKPDLSQGQYYLGYTYAKLGMRDRAMAYLTEAVRLEPGKQEYQQALNLVKNGQSLP